MGIDNGSIVVHRSQGHGFVKRLSGNVLNRVARWKNKLIFNLSKIMKSKKVQAKIIGHLVILALVGDWLPLGLWQQTFW
jgi:hypothetical protein